MAITTSRGYPGLVTASDYAILSRHQGQTYAVMAYNHYAATAGTGDRGVAISVGTAIGHGVMVENTGASVNLNADVMGSAGSRWDTVALERDWVNKTSQLVILKGTSAKAISGSRLQNVGTGKDHQPLWLIRVENGKTAIQEFVDLRVWQQDGGMFAADPMARDYMTALGTDMLCKNGTRYIRVLDTTSGMPVWSEHRAAPFGERPRIVLRRVGGYTGWNGVGQHHSPTQTIKQGDADTHFAWTNSNFTDPGGALTLKTAGVYRLGGRAMLDGGPSSYYVNLSFFADYLQVTSIQGESAVGGYCDLSIAEESWFPAGSRIQLRQYTNRAINTRDWAIWAARISD